MKKHIKWTAVLSTAAFMTALTPVFAAPTLAQTTGWVENDGSWMFYDSDGYHLTDSWKKQDGEWYYLDENGYIAFNTQVDEYYVGSNGRRVYNQWVSIANDDDWRSDDEPDFYWFYYGKDGKAITSKFRSIDDKTYYFDNEGRMVTGLQEIEGATYYFGEESDGVMKKGWIQLEDENSSDPDDEFSWYYFDSDGKMVVNEIDKKISGSYYTFVEGKMQTGWYKLPADAVISEDSSETDTQATSSNADVSETSADNAADSTADSTANGTADSATSSASAESAAKDSAAGYQYYDEDGKRAAGWRTIEGIAGISEEGETYNFFFKNGQPYFAQSGIQVFNVNNSKYGFNTKGEMQTGLQSVTLEDGTFANYYFGTDGAMKTGKQTIFDEESGLNQTWFFHTDGIKRGQGYHGINNNVIYENGLRKEADADLRYAPVEFEGTKYLVNASGTIQKASSSSKSTDRPDLGAGYRDLKDSNYTVWTVDVNGIIQ